MISERMDLEGHESRVHPLSIHRDVFSPIEQREGFPGPLALGKSRQGRRAKNGKREPTIPHRTPHSERPESAKDLLEFGHWEGDLFHFPRPRDILLALDERSSRMTLVRRLQSKDARITADAIIVDPKRLPATARKTITHDNGGEFPKHIKVRQALNMPAYNCDPRSPWQRACDENVNRRIRLDLPRKTDLFVYSDGNLNDPVWIMNSTPQKCLGFKAPLKTFA